MTAMLLVDDHPVVRDGYRRLLERQAGWRVVAEAENAVCLCRLPPGAPGYRARGHVVWLAIEAGLLARHGTD